MVVASLWMVFAPTAYAATLDEQINGLKAQISQQQSTADAARSQANTLAGQVAILNAQISEMQAQLALNKAEQERTTTQIAEAQEQLTIKKGILDESIRAIYQQSQVSPIEMLASSKNFSEYVDKQQYSDQIKDHVQDSLAQVNKLKADLDIKQRDLNTQIAAQSGYEANLQAQRQQQASLLAQAQGNAAAADSAIKGNNAQVAKLQAQQAAIIQAASSSYNGSVPGASGGSGGACDNGHGNGGYPAQWCNGFQDQYNTPWGYSRECVSWAGWRRSQMGRAVPGGWGNANTWDDNAGYGRISSTPAVGDIAQTDKGPYGHVAVVEAVNGSSIVVSEMNYDSDGHFRYGSYPASYFEHYIR